MPAHPFDRDEPIEADLVATCSHQRYARAGVTQPSLTAPLDVTSIDAAVAALRDAGLRLSTARRVVLEALFRAKRPLSAEQLAEGAEGMPPSDVASVYRNLETLERLGVVRHVHLGHGPGLYALAGTSHEEYLLCESCGQTQAVDPSQLEDVRNEIRERFKFQARFSHFPLSGLCQHCAEGRAAGAGRGGRA
jgi:Fur family ferric uptake transcriptional regulator